MAAPDNDAAYASNSGSTPNSSSTATAEAKPASGNVQTQTSQPSAANSANLQSSASAATASYPSTTAAAQTPVSQQTSRSDASYYNQYGAQDSTSSEYMDMSYASDYSAEAASEAAYAKAVAQAQAQAEEAATAHVLVQAQRGAEATAPETPPPQQAAPVESPSAAPAVVSNGPVTPPAVHRGNESLAIPALHHDTEASDWQAILALTDGSTQLVEAPDQSPGGLRAGAIQEESAAVPESGALMAGAVPFNLEEMERSVGRFFAHLDEQGWNWFREIRVASLGSWLAAGAAATAAFELARRSVRARFRGPAGSLAGGDDNWLADSDCSFTVPDEP
jgi:hypothetical protein